MRPEGGLEQFAHTKQKEPFNTQMAEQLQGLQPESVSGDFDDHETTTEHPIVETGNDQESLDITLNTPEQLHELRDVMQKQVEETEALRSTAAAVGYKNITYHGLVGAACFDELHQKQSELESVLGDIEKSLLEDDSYEISEIEYDEIQLHVDLMQDLSNTLEDAVATLDATDESEKMSEQTESIGEELQSFVAETRQFYQVASSWFPHANRDGEVYEYLNGLLADAEHAQSLMIDSNSKPESLLQEQLHELTESAAAYESHLRELHEQLKYHNKTSDSDTEHLSINQLTATAEPLVLTQEQRVDTVESVEDVAELYKDAVEQMMQIDSYPYYDTTERTTVKNVFKQLQTAVEAGDSMEVVRQKYNNLQSVIEMLAEPDVDVMKRRADRIVEDLEYVQFAHEEDKATALAMHENFARQHADVSVSEDTLRKSYDSLAEYVHENADVTGSLFGVVLPESGAAGVHDVRTLRRTLIGISDARSGVELTRGQRAAVESLIAVLQYAAHDELTDEQAAEVRSLAKQVRAGELIIPYTLEKELEVEEDIAETKEEEMVTKTGRISVKPELEEADETVAISVRSQKPTPEEVWDDLDSLEPAIANETFDYGEESLEAVAQTQSQPAPVVSNPVENNLSDTNEAVLAAVEANDPVNATNRPTVESWEARRERRAGGSVAKRVITGPLLEQLKQRGVTPRDIDRKVYAEIQRFDTKNAPSWFEKLSVPNPVFQTFKDKTVAEIQSIQEEFPAGFDSEFEERYQASHTVFYSQLTDYIQQELLQVVPNYSPDMTLEELVALYIAVQETE